MLWGTDVFQMVRAHNVHIRLLSRRRRSVTLWSVHQHVGIKGQPTHASRGRDDTLMLGLHRPSVASYQFVQERQAAAGRGSWMRLITATQDEAAHEAVVTYGLPVDTSPPRPSSRIPGGSRPSSKQPPRPPTGS